MPRGVRATVCAQGPSTSAAVSYTHLDVYKRQVYDQVYHLSGQDEEHIRALAARVDAKMRAVAGLGRTADSLRVAVLAALNLADELSQLERATSAQSLSLIHISWHHLPGTRPDTS